MNNSNGYRAIAKYLPVSAHKVRPVARCIRSCYCERALAILDALPQKGAALISKVLRSAIANAVDRNSEIDKSKLVISLLLINEGPQSKKMWARSRGRADRLIKRTSHIVIVVKERE